MSHHDVLRQEASFRWKYEKLGLEPEDLWTTLFQRFNTQRTPIQEDEAFYYDVAEISKEASNREQFFDLLEKRRAHRVDELTTALRRISSELSAHPGLWGSDEEQSARWYECSRLCFFWSFDIIVSFLATYLPEDYLEQDRIREERAQRWRTKFPASPKSHERPPPRPQSPPPTQYVINAHVKAPEDPGSTATVIEKEDNQTDQEAARSSDALGTNFTPSPSHQPTVETIDSTIIPHSPPKPTSKTSSVSENLPTTYSSSPHSSPLSVESIDSATIPQSPPKPSPKPSSISGTLPTTYSSSPFSSPPMPTKSEDAQRKRKREGAEEAGHTREIDREAESTRKRKHIAEEIVEAG